MTEIDLESWEREANETLYIFNHPDSRKRQQRILSLISEVKALREENKNLVGENFQLREALKHADAAMTYAYEDHSDQYYLNVQKQIREAMNPLSNG